MNLIDKAKKFIENFIKSKIEPKWFVYHNLDHTLSVYDRATYLADKIWIDSNSKEVLLVAALFHDTWLFKGNYNWHEKESVKVFKLWVLNENIKVSEDFVKNVSRLIMVTKIDADPNRLDEKILKDSDLDNLWTDKFFYNTKLLKQEIENITCKDIKICNLLTNTRDLFKDFSFYTDIQKIERLAKWKENFNILTQLIEMCKKWEINKVERIFADLSI